MTDEVAQKISELLSIEDGESLAGEVARCYLTDEFSPWTTEVVRGVAAQRPDLHWRWKSALPVRGANDERYIELLLVLLPEIWSHDQMGTEGFLASLLDAEVQPQATVSAAVGWVANARLGFLDFLYPGLSAWACAQELGL